jgi:hypothetical protein
VNSRQSTQHRRRRYCRHHPRRRDDSDSQSESQSRIFRPACAVGAPEFRPPEDTPAATAAALIRRSVAGHAFHQLDKFLPVLAVHPKELINIGQERSQYLFNFIIGQY